VEQKHTARCVNCRAEIVVPATYAHGDHIKCGSCGMKHKVARGDVLRLVLADVTPLKEAVQANRERIARLDDELRGARRSFGLGVNGLGVGLIYALWEITQHEATLGSELIRDAVLVAVASGLLMELANYLFLAKRHRITRITQEIEALDGEVRQLEQRVREASRM
jgi:hypothetical protein